MPDEEREARSPAFGSVIWNLTVLPLAKEHVLALVLQHDPLKHAVLMRSRSEQRQQPATLRMTRDAARIRPVDASSRRRL